MKRIYMMCGIPGSGKSTWLRMKFKEIEEKENLKCAIVSRDKIRFTFLQQQDKYFAKETEVFKMFVNCINYAISNTSADVIFADATNLTIKSRKQLLKKINLENVEVIPVAFVLPFETCVNNNSKRSGLERVPDEEMERMRRIYQVPTIGENKSFSDIIYVSY